MLSDQGYFCHESHLFYQLTKTCPVGYEEQKAVEAVFFDVALPAL